MLVDSHCHLFDMKGYSLPRDLAAVVVGYSPGSNAKAAEWGKKGFPTVMGIAPQTAIKRDDLAELCSWMDFIRQNRPNAIGEVGLDYKWAGDAAQVEKERGVFRAMIDLADEMKLPLVIHSRNRPDAGAHGSGEGVPKDAIAEILGMVEGRRFVMHFYSGDEAQARRIVDMGGFISVTHMRSKERRKVINTVPLDRLMVESDAPYVGKTPESIREAIAYVAEVKGLSAEDAGRQTAENAAGFFGFSLPEAGSQRGG
jgi:TatD DNase family protein